MLAPFSATTTTPFRVGASPPYFVIVGLLAVLLAPTAAWAQGALPPVLQAALIARIFQADDSLRGKSREAARLLVLTGNGKEAAVRSLLEALVPTQIATQELSVTELSSAGEGVAALYVADAADAPAAQKYCAQHGVLSMAGDTTLAEQGLVAVALGTTGGNHPEIVVSSKQLAAQHHALAAALLKLARVVQ